MSPVVLGLALFTLYGRTGWLGPVFSERGVDVIFALPGMVLATVFVSLPFVVNEVAPVLEEIGTDAERAAVTLGASGWQTFTRITLPAIRWGVTYGVVLTTARALGEFGAVAIVSGNLADRTQTLPLYVEDRFTNFDLTGAYAAGTLLALIAVAVLVALTPAGAYGPPTPHPPGAAVTITVSHVGKAFGTFTALDDVSITVPDGSLTALLGPSGGGKSTLLRIVAGLEHPDRGSVHIGGVDVTRTHPRDRGIGFVFQHYAAFTHMTVAENVAFGLRVRRRPKERIRARVGELLELVHLEGHASRYPSELSGGQRQRMVLARALAVEPRVLLLDEPFGALDAAIRAELRDWLRALHEQIDVTTVFVTHDQEEALELAEQIVLVTAGRVEQVGSPDDLYERPASPFVMTFVGASTRLNGGWHRPHDIRLVPAAADVAGAGAAAGTAGTATRVTPLITHTRVDVRVPGQPEPVVVDLPRGGDAARALRPGEGGPPVPRAPTICPPTPDRPRHLWCLFVVTRPRKAPRGTRGGGFSGAGGGSSSRRRRSGRSPWSIPTGVRRGRRWPGPPRRRSPGARSAGGPRARHARRPGRRPGRAARATQGVSAVPGDTAFTRMPSWTWSAAIARVSAATAPFEARVQRPVRHADEGDHRARQDHRRRPRGAQVRQGRTDHPGGAGDVDVSTRAHSSSSPASTVPTAPIPALLTRTSRPPSSPTTRATAARTTSSRLTSQVSDSRPASGAGARSSTATRAPRSRNRRAVARPIPDAPPVTAATSPARSRVSPASLACRAVASSRGASWCASLGCSVMPSSFAGAAAHPLAPANPTMPCPCVQPFGAGRRGPGAPSGALLGRWGAARADGPREGWTP